MKKSKGETPAKKAASGSVKKAEDLVKKHNNTHRANKYPFQVMMLPDKKEVLDDVKLLRGQPVNSNLLFDLLDEERERLRRAEQKKGKKQKSARALSE